MRVKFKVNLGSQHAAELGLDHKECVEGAEIDVSAKAAEWLAKKGIVYPLAGMEAPAGEGAGRPSEGSEEGRPGRKR